MVISHARRMNLVALSLLLTALIAFVAFHFLVVEPESGGDQMGWQIWPSLYDFLKRADFSEPRGMIAAASFLCASLLVILAPFLIPVFRKSRLMWWVVVIPSGMATFGFGGIILMNIVNSGSSYGPGIPCLLAAFGLHFTGLLFIRREGAPSPIPEAAR